MAAFIALREVSSDFENELRRVSAELFSAKINKPFEDVIAKKMQDLSMFTSKLRFLQAKTLACTPQVTDSYKNEQLTLGNYGEAATWKIIEQQVVKSVTHSHVVKRIITTPNSKLDPDIVERKEKIIEYLEKYRQQESVLLNLEKILSEKELKLLEARKRWDEVANRMKEKKKVPQNTETATGPLYTKLQGLVDKLELMRWLITKLVTSRTDDYDWASDPHNRLRALTMARQKHCIENYTEAE